MLQSKYVTEEETSQQFEYAQMAKEIVTQRAKSRGSAMRALILTYGCQQNEEDSEKISGMLLQMGYELTEDRAVADIIILNTCAVREHAEQRVFGNIGALKGVKQARPDVLIGLCGCMAQQEHIEQTVREKYRHIDLFFGPLTLFRLPEIIFKALSNKEKVFMIDRGNGRIAEGLPQIRRNTFSAYITISSGCNNFCSYCVVPYVRGRERSRQPQMIIEEVKTLVNEGYRDIFLLGQNVNSYGNDLTTGGSFSKLLREVNDIKGDFRVRFMTSHPKDITKDVIDTMASCEKVCKHLHLPVQSGSNEILAKMNRHYTVESYLKTIDYARERMPDITFTSDIIVGFPGENDEMFLDTLNLIKTVRYEMIFSFIFSRRKGTPAYDMDGQIPYDEKLKRFNMLLKAQEEISAQQNVAYEGKTVRLLCTGHSDKNPDLLAGRTDSNKLIFFEGDDCLIGTFVNVTVTETKAWFSFGKIEV